MRRLFARRPATGGGGGGGGGTCVGGVVRQHCSALGCHGDRAALAIGTLDSNCLVIDGDDASLDTLTQIYVLVDVSLTHASHMVTDDGTDTEQRGDRIHTHFLVRE